MVATVVVELVYGGAGGTYSARDTGTVVAGGGVRYMTYDNGSDSSITTYPIPIPTAANGLSGSYWVTNLISVTVTPSTYIKNLKYYQTWTSSPCADWDLSGAGWAGEKLKPGLYIGISGATVAEARALASGGMGFPSSSYAQATGVEGVYGNIISGTSGHPYYSGGAWKTPVYASGGMVSIANFDSLSNAYIVQSGSVVDNPDTGRSWCIVTQVLVGSGATAGNKTDKTATWSYTEA